MVMHLFANKNGVFLMAIKSKQNFVLGESKKARSREQNLHNTPKQAVDGI